MSGSLDITSFFTELASEQGKSLILSAVAGVAKRIKTDIDWKKIFVDSGRMFINSEQEAGNFIDELSEILSKKSLKELAGELRKDPGYRIEEKALDYLVRLMGKHGIPHDRAVVYSKNLLVVILEKIMDSYPDRYDRFFQSDWRNMDIVNNKVTLEKIEAVSKQLEEFKNQGIKILSSDDIDLYLQERFDLPFFGVSFFEVDDNQFCEYLSNHKTDERIYVKCKCKEEAIYCIINELWHQKDMRPVFVVKSEENWNALRKINNSGNIYIPDFWADEIIAIPNNTNIFVMQENFPLFTKNYVELRPRTRGTIISCLERAGMDSFEASELVTKNHGLFTLMKRKLIKGVYKNNPEWVGRIPVKVVKTCLLLCSWEDIEGDQLIIEELSGLKYDDFISEIIKYTKGDDPFVVLISRYGKKYYSLANIEDSWLFYDVSINEDIWKKYIEIFSYVMTQDEKLLSYESIFDKTKAEIKGEKFDWSGTIRSGMVHSLMVKTYYLNDEHCQTTVNNVVLSILSTITNKQRWKYISNYFRELTELAPLVILKRLIEEFNKPTGMIQLFTEKSDNFLWGTHYYFNILWSLEQLLLQREFATKALEVVLRLDNLDVEYKSNNPREIIRTVLCVWGNFSAFDTVKAKIEAANLAFKYDNNAWDIINSVLPDNQQTIFGSFSKPLYRNYVRKSGVSRMDYNSLVNTYFSLLLKNTFFNPERWIALLDSVNQLSDESNSIAIASLLSSLNEMDDLNIIRIKDSIRETIYKHRFYNTASWTMKEERIKKYEELLEKIYVKTPEYEYAYFFNYPEMDFPLLHPHVFSEEDYMSKNETIAKNLIKEKTLEFKKKKLSLSVLASCCATRNGMVGSRYVKSYLGWYLALYWDENGFDDEVFLILLKAQQNGLFACDYFKVLGEKASGHFNEALAIAKAEVADMSIIVDLYQTEAQYSDGIPAIDKADADEKKAFWEKYYFGYFVDVVWALAECKKYGTGSSYIRLLYHLNEKNHFDSDFIYNHLKDISSLAVSESDRVEGHYLTSLLVLIQDDCNKVEEKRIQIAQIEILFSQKLEWSDMKCLQFEVKSRPDLLMEILKIIYKTDDGSVSEIAMRNKEYWSFFYQVYNKMEFCPVEESGYVDEDKFLDWIRQFDELTANNKQTSIRGMVLGRLLSFSPAGRDGFYPCEAVRRFIEKNDDPKMLIEYQIAVENNRGVYTGSEGKDELVLSERYKQNADYLAIEFPRTASIYYSIADHYRKQSLEERKRAEDDF